MGILGNMQLLSSCSRILTLLKYQNRYCGCGGSQRYHHGRCAVLKLPFVAPKFRLRRVKKKGGKRAKNDKLRFAKTTIFFCVFTSWTLFLGSIRIRKVVWRRCARQKNFFTFGHQLRCAILEIASYIYYKF